MVVNPFSYHPSHSPLSRIPPGPKLLAVLATAFSIPHLNMTASLILLPLLLLLARLAGIPIWTQLSELRHTMLYPVLLYLYSVASSIMQARTISTAVLLPTQSLLLSSLHFITAVQVASLLYKTTTPTQLRDTLAAVESSLRRRAAALPGIGKKIREEASLSFSAGLTLAFIPRTVTLWNQLAAAWKARGGREGLGKLRHLLPQLIVLAMAEAGTTWMAICNRALPSGKGARPFLPQDTQQRSKEKSD